MWSSIFTIPPLVGQYLTQVNAVRDQLVPSGSQTPQMLAGVALGLFAIALATNSVAHWRAAAPVQPKADIEASADFAVRFQHLRRYADIAQEVISASSYVEELLRDPWLYRRDLLLLARRPYYCTAREHCMWLTKKDIAIRRLRKLQERAHELEQVPVEIAKLLL